MKIRKRRIVVLGAIAGALVIAAAISTPTLANAGPSSPSTPIPVAPYLVHQRFRLDGDGGTVYSPNAMNYAARTNPDAPLLLFLPATRGRPAEYTEFLNAARERGFHVLALDYWNRGPSVEATCGMNSQCYTDVQRNRLTGAHPTIYSSVADSNSIVDRFTTAIRHLDASDPSGGWARFAGRRGIDWGDIVVAGHSQGGGESAYIAHIHRVLGVLMFSSPVDSLNGVNASWMAHPGATSTSRMYGFDNTGDKFSARIQASWRAMGLDRFGPAANVARRIPSTAHVLLSHAHLGTPSEAHLFDITNGCPDTSSGQPAFENVWKWMLGRVWTGAPIDIS